MFDKIPRVLVPIVRSGPKKFAYDFYPRFAQKLNYPDKEILLIDESNCPKLKGLEVGELIAATGRQFAIEYARKNNFDKVYFQDLDLEPDPNLLTDLVNTKEPLVGSLVAARGNANLIIGHNYNNWDEMYRLPLYYPGLKDGDIVDGIGGCSLLVDRLIFIQVDYTGYTGPDTISGRYTADDEYLLIQIYKKLKIRSKIITKPRSWHYHDDGFKYRILGEKKKWDNHF